MTIFKRSLIMAFITVTRKYINKGVDLATVSTQELETEMQKYTKEKVESGWVEAFLKFGGEFGFLFLHNLIYSAEDSISDSMQGDWKHWKQFWINKFRGILS